MASFAPSSNPVSLNERLESGLRAWVNAAQVELNRTVPSTDVIRNVMNQGTHLYAVSARLFDAAECAGELGVDTAAGAREHLRTAMKELSRADRLWGSVTTAMRPSHEYVAAARQLHAALTETTHDGLRAYDVKEITEHLDIGQALADLRYAACDVADMVRDVQQLPDQLLRSGVLFAPASKLPPSVTRLHDRATGRYVSILPNEMAELANTARSATRASDLAVGKVDTTILQGKDLVVMGLSAALKARVPEL
jgi:hypothetical protein